MYHTWLLPCLPLHTAWNLETDSLNIFFSSHSIKKLPAFLILDTKHILEKMNKKQKIGVLYTKEDM